MSDTLTVTGVVATTPSHIVTSTGLPITSFRLASTQRRYDRAQQKWVDSETNWYTVTCFRQLANNVVASITTGQRIVVSGRLRIRDWKTEEKAGTNVEIDADAVGHDLAWGTTVYTRSVSAAVVNDGDAPSDRVADVEPGAESGAERSGAESSGAESSAAEPATLAEDVPVPF